DARSAALLATAIGQKGIKVVLEAQTAAIEGSGRAERVVLKDGRAYPAELVVMAAGIRPATALAESGGLAIGRGIKVDDALETSSPGIYAIGECAEHRGTCCGLIEPVYEQAKVLARHLAGLPARYEGSVSAASLKVSARPSRPGPTRSTWPPWPASRRQAGSSRPRRRPSATSIPSMPTAASGTRARRGCSPRASTISVGASTGCSTWRRHRTPTC